MVPDFFVIGAFRCGTTALYRTLRQHPQVFLPMAKEPNFFAIDGNPDASASLRARSVADAAEYEALYAKASPSQRSGDISPEYLANPWVAPRLARVAPDAPLVAILRNPIERAWSDYLLHVRDGNEPCARFGDALAQQAARQRVDGWGAHYIDTGFYAAQLARYLAVFPRRQLQVWLFEDLVRDRAGVLAELFAHIGVDPTFVPEDEAPVNASGVPSSAALALVLRTRRRLRPYVNAGLVDRVRPQWERFLSTRLDRPALLDEDWATLADIYRDDVAKLGDLLGRDLSHWLQR